MVKISYNKKTEGYGQHCVNFHLNISECLLKQKGYFTEKKEGDVLNYGHKKRATTQWLEPFLIDGASGRNRTGTDLTPRDFKSRASTNFATEA